MRTIEVLAMGKKLITTNFQIKKEPFLFQRIMCWSQTGINLSRSAVFQTEAKPVDMSALLLKNWVLEFFL